MKTGNNPEYTTWLTKKGYHPHMVRYWTASGPIFHSLWWLWLARLHTREPGPSYPLGLNWMWYTGKEGNNGCTN